MQISTVMLQALKDRKDSSDYEGRMQAVQAAATSDWQQAMQQKLGKLLSEPSSVRVKLRKLYTLADEAHQNRASVIACKAGCSACCHIQVEINEAEARLIGDATGRKPRQLPPGRHTTPAQQLGKQDTPCTFLVQGKCSIYEHRPFVCREMAVLDVDALTCSFENMYLARMNDPRAVLVPQANMPPLRQAMLKIVQGSRSGAWADIRQFFP